MQGKSLLVVFGILVGVFVAGAVYMYATKGIQQESQTASPSPASTSAAATPSATESGQTSDQVKEITVIGTEYAFSPKSFTFTRGERVKLTFVNNGKLPHNLMVDELGVSTETISGGKQTSVEFTAQETGSFTMYCSVGNHRALGMEGPFEVK